MVALGLRRDHQDAETRIEFDRTMMAIQSSVRAYRPARVAEDPSGRVSRDFLRWAEGWVGADSYARIRRIDDTYTQAAARAGLMSRGTIVDEIREDLRHQMRDRPLGDGERKLLMMRRGLYLPRVDQ